MDFIYFGFYFEEKENMYNLMKGIKVKSINMEKPNLHISL